MPKLLVADDNTNIQKMVALAFQDRGVEVIAVGNGEAAVRRLPDLHPDIVLADVFMPVRNGYEVCEFVKKDERFSHIPVILLVGAFDPLDEKEARRVGADGVLKKPFVPPDPLIAMVMSALEKNPKLAAELAKAREVVVEPPPPPMPAMEIAAKAEPKPLPHYPEPTAEEAAAIYGFGKGVRALDDEPDPATPKSLDVEADDEKEEFDGAATTADWRRSAADFEVPEEAGGKLAFTPDEDFGPSTFPSERDVPPRHIRVEDPAEETEPVVAKAISAPAPAPPPPAPSPAAVAAVVEPVTSSSSRFHETQIATVSAPAPDYGPPRSAMEIKPVEAPAVGAPPVIAEVKHDSGRLSKAAHWMDMMAPTPSEKPNGGWMANLLGLLKEPEVTHAPPDPSALKESAEPPVDTTFEAPVEAKAKPVDGANVEELSPAVASHSEFKSSAQPEIVVPPAVAELFETVQPPDTSKPWFTTPLPLLEAGGESSLNRLAAQQQVASARPAAAVQVDEFEREREDAEPSFREPLLMESPAVHVEPEPLLVDDDITGPSEYGQRSERPTPLHSFFTPPSGDPAVEAPAAPEPPARTEFPAFQPPAIDADASDEFDERIPTVPPPNREAIAAIPFLTPPILTPQEIRSEDASAHQSAAALDSGNMDEVVRRVLEKLQPQLQELLSQGVLKPLVENMLQTELAKKGK